MHICMYIYIYMYIRFKKSKIYIKTFSELLRYVNFGAVAACRVFACESYAV